MYLRSLCVKCILILCCLLPLQQQQLDLGRSEENDFQTFFCKSLSSHREDDKVGEMLILMIFFFQVITIYNFWCSHKTSNETITKRTFFLFLLTRIKKGSSKVENIEISKSALGKFSGLTEMFGHILGTFKKTYLAAV